MGMELEFKLAVPNPALLEQILFDQEVAEARQGDYHLLQMATVYYDTPDRRFSLRRWTLRLRQENETFVATIKTPAEDSSKARGEWSVEVCSIQDALPRLIAEGAPAELADLTADRMLIPVCAARFTRRAADVVFADGTVCELCGDIGTLTGGDKEEALCEIEVELKEGNPDTAETFAGELMKRFHLQEEPRSKFARANALAKEGTR